ncbi:ion transporter [Spirosoma montaniterrae]|uniref:Potassium channel protein n=1 Tax=Spirosoma montaniterrae TaxID=1178516 RepID=A0A1P9WY11_9BACT|nr:ion transporter [Spirosoma montaniterrae]AQG80254.1 potassium channel protein [Spirosoma montaniterrae]
MLHFRKTLFRILETSAGNRRGISLLFNVVLITIITLNAIAIVLNTVPAYNQRFARLFYDLELFSVMFFTIEYIARLWVCVEQERYQHWFWGRLRYMLSTPAIIDFLAIFPFYFTLFATDLAVVRILRLFRIFRLFRISKYSHAVRVIRAVVDNTKEELILVLVFVVFMLIIISSVVYYIEHPVQPDKFSSIPATMWWGTSAMTTVGYGDLHPITPLGKFIGGLASILGIMLFALPTSILVSGFNEYMRTHRKSPTTRQCPHCGKVLND